MDPFSEFQSELLGARERATTLSRHDVEPVGLTVGKHFDAEPVGARGHDVEGALRRVVGAREMHEDEARDAGVLERARELGGLFVGEVADGTGDATPEARRVGSSLEQARAVVRFEEDDVARREEGAKLAGDVTEIGREAEAPAAGRDAEGNLGGVVRDGEGFDDEGAERDGAAGRVRADFEAAAGARRGDALVKMERRAQGSGDGEGVGGVVAVVVGDEEAEGRARGHEVRAQGAHALDRPGGSHAGVEDEALAFGFDDEAVPARAATEDEDAHCAGNGAAASAEMSNGSIQMPRRAAERRANAGSRRCRE